LRPQEVMVGYTQSGIMEFYKLVVRKQVKLI
jgi:hypothetical protein